MSETAQLEALIKKIMKEVQDGGIDLVSSPTKGNAEGDNGVFDTVDEAIQAAKIAQLQYEGYSLESRRKLISAIREEMSKHTADLGDKSAKETGMGRAEDKRTKIELAINKTPGVEDLHTEAETGDNGMTLYELSPYGVIGAILPSTNPIPTLINNAIGMLAAGNGIYFSVHPGALNVSTWTVQMINQTIEKTIGIKNLVVTIAKPSNDKVGEMMAHPDIAILVVTGGPGIVRQALSSGKKAIGAGAGNPPALVDETANVEKAAKDITWGASFDNGILCTAEKSVVAVKDIEERLVHNMEQENAYLLKNKEDIDKLLDITLGKNNNPDRKYIGKNASFLLKEAGIKFSGDPKLIILRAEQDHPFVMKEMLMPILPIVKANDFEEALEMAVAIEQNLHHTATMHSKDVGRMNRVARALKTSIFVKNGPSFAGLGINGEGPTTFTIATPTGEGTTTARHFSRRRRCVLTDGFSLK